MTVPRDFAKLPCNGPAHFAGRTCLIPRRAWDDGKLWAGILSFLLLLLASPTRAQVTGTVTLTGTPNSKDESFYARANGCGESPIRHTENWKVGPKGELADVVVWVVVDPKWHPAGAISWADRMPTAISQVQCRYEPHVIAETAAVPFDVINKDSTLHNVRAKVYNGPGQPPGDDVFNFGQSYAGQTDKRQFDDPGIYTLQCDVHSWMQAWVYVLPSRAGFRFFEVTNPKGEFSIPATALLPDGDYKVDAWHPRFAQTLEQNVHVKGGVGVVNFIFDGTKSF